jgi:TonB-linked SusC/RagA family outer membrane protein
MMSPRLVSAKWVLAFSLLAGAAGTALAQGATVTGKVTDANGVPLSNASVSILSTTIGATTREDGSYTLSRVPAGVRKVHVQRISFAEQETEVNIPATGNVEVNFKLTVQTLRLDQVVSIGVTDPTSGKKLPITVATINAEDMPVPVRGTPAAALAGRVAGVQVYLGRGTDPGVTIRMRTPVTQFEDFSPMYIVDGVIMQNATVDVDALDVASIQVIKGSSASSLYGSKAANGVIAITTNRGKDTPIGTSRIQTREEYGFNTTWKAYNKTVYHFYKMNADYIDSLGNVVPSTGPYKYAPGNTYVDTIGRPVPRLNRITDRLKNESNGFMDNLYFAPTYDASKQFLAAPSTSRTNATLSQNVQTTNFSASVNFQRDPGIIRHIYGSQNAGLRINLDHRRSDKLSFAVSANTTRNLTEPNPSNIVTDMTEFRADVNLLAPPIPGSGVPYLIIPDSNESRTNPLYRTWKQNSWNRRAQTTLSSDANYALLSWMSLAGNVSYNRTDGLNDAFTEKGTLQTDGVTPDNGSYSKTDAASYNLNASLSTTFLKAFGDMTARTTMQALVQKQVSSGTTASTTTFTTSGVKELQTGSVPSVSSSFTDRRTVSFLGTSAFDYAGKYIADVVFREDGSSGFGPENRWNPFYRYSAAYRIAEEPWWPIPALNEFKIRYSVGVGGTQPAFLDQFEVLSIQGGGGLERRDQGNPDLKPEKAVERELALETAFKSRYSLILSWANNHSFDQIVDVAAAGATGFNTQSVNTGQITGDTYEATIQAQLIQTRNLQWSMDIVGDQGNYVVKEFNRPCYGDDNGFGIRCEGYKMTWAFGSKWMKSAADLPPWMQKYSDQFNVNDDGWLVWVGSGNTYMDGVAKDLWGTTSATFIDSTAGRSFGFTNTYSWGRPAVVRDSANATAQLFIGDFAPKGNFGWGNSVRWKALSFYALFRGQYGGQIYNSGKRTVIGDLRSKFDVQVDKPLELKKPTTYYSSGYTTGGNTQYYMETGTWAKLQEVNVTFRVPPSRLGFLTRAGIKQANIQFSGRDLALFTKYSGLDPENTSTTSGNLSRIDAITQPRYRNWTTVLQLTF